MQSEADDTFGTFAVVSLAGAGDNLVIVPAGATAGIVTATHDGSRNFSIIEETAELLSMGMLVNEIGGALGYSAAQLRRAERAVDVRRRPRRPAPHWRTALPPPCE